MRLLLAFEYRLHTALVFTYQAMNLRETLKKFGKDVGINVTAIRLYSRQLFSALKFLGELSIVHADIKLDNILCSADLKQVCASRDKKECVVGVEWCGWQEPALNQCICNVFRCNLLMCVVCCCVGDSV